MANLGNYKFQSILKEMAVGMNEYNGLVYATDKVVRNYILLKGKEKSQKETFMEAENGKGNKHLRRELSIMSELQRGINVKGKMSRKLKRK